MPNRLDQRISFHADIETMEADFSDLELNTPEAVNTFYDRIEDRIHATGQEQWYFLVNYRNCRIDPSAWLAHSLRGKRLNLTHSLGSVRFDASEETRAEIARRANTEAFDANLFDNRDAALARIEELRRVPTRRLADTDLVPPTIDARTIPGRIRFLEAEGIMDVDFEDLVFETNSDVNIVYDHLEARIAETGRKWYFLVNYTGCVIALRAWISFAQRGKRLNIASSLGSVRYGTSPDLEAEIRDQASRKDFRPNIRATREEALERIAEMKAEALAGAD